ncbi:hypothetical protein GCM10017706_26920 [Lactococcus lactis subsp. hordniae]
MGRVFREIREMKNLSLAKVAGDYENSSNLITSKQQFHVLNLVNLIPHSQKFTDRFSVSKFIHKKNSLTNLSVIFNFIKRELVSHQPIQLYP